MNRIFVIVFFLVAKPIGGFWLQSKVLETRPKIEATASQLLVSNPSHEEFVRRIHRMSYRPK